MLSINNEISRLFISYEKLISILPNSKTIQRLNEMKDLIQSSNLDLNSLSTEKQKELLKLLMTPILSTEKEKNIEIDFNTNTLVEDLEEIIKEPKRALVAQITKVNKTKLFDIMEDEYDK